MPTAVFYSVSPFGTGTIETGAGNISITDGVATLTVEQTGNIGAGVAIEYNSTKAYICPNRIGFDSGGTTELKTGDKIEGGTSGATGIARFIELTSGTWAGGNAAGWIYFEETTGTFQDNEQINRTQPSSSSNIATVDGTIEGNVGDGNTEFVVKTATGGTPSNQTATAVTSIHHEFDSLQDFSTDYINSSHINNTSLVSAGVTAFACCYYDHDDQTTDDELTLGAVAVTTSADNYVCVFTPTGGAESINSQRHEGEWDDDKYVLYANDGVTGRGLRCDLDDVRVFGLQVSVTRNNYFKNGISFTGTGDCVAAFNICKANFTGSGNDSDRYAGIWADNSSLTLYAHNNIVYGWTRSGATRITGIENNYGTTYAYFNTVRGNSVGIWLRADDIDVTNCAVFDHPSGEDFHTYSGTMTVDHCASDDGDGTNAVDWTSESTDWNNVFNDQVNHDYSLKNFTGTGAIIGQGTAVSGAEGLWRDIIGTIRDSSSPDIGAFEYVASGPTYTLSADAGSLELAGTAAETLHNRSLNAEAGALALAGTEVTLIYGNTYTLTADAGSLELTGTAASTLYNRVITADNGSLALSGTGVALFHNRVLLADAGVFSLSGTEVALLYNRTLAADAGSLTLSGTDVTFIYGNTYSLNAEAGSLTLTGTAAGLLYNRTLTAEAGALALTGIAAETLYNRSLTSEPGSLELAGTEVTFVYGANYVLTAEAGALELAGVDAGTLYNRVFVAEAGALELSGTAAGLLYNRTLNAETGALGLSGTTTGLLYNRTLISDTGALTLTGTATGLLYNRALITEIGTLELTGTDSELLLNRVLTAEVGSLVLSGTDVIFVYGADYLLATESGSLVLSGTDAKLISSAIATGTINTAFLSKKPDIVFFASHPAISFTNN